MAREGHEPLLKKSRCCVLKRKENLTSQRNLGLRELLRYNPQTVRAYLLKEDCQQFWEYNSPTWAGNFWISGCYQVMHSRASSPCRKSPAFRSSSQESMPHASRDSREVLNAGYWQTCANCSICVTVSVVGLP